LGLKTYATIQWFIYLNKNLFTLIEIEILSLVQQEVSVSTVNSVWLIRTEKVLRLVTVLTKKNYVASYERKAFADLAYFTSDLLDASF